MKYNEKDLTEATKIMSYLRSIRIYAVAITILSLLYLGAKIAGNTRDTELYLILIFTGVVLTGCVSVIIRLNHKTANIHGLSCIIAGLIYLFSIIYYQGETAGFFTAVGFVAGLIVIRQGVSIAFGSRARDAFSGANQKKVSFVQKQIEAMKKSLIDEKDVIHSKYTDDKGKKRDLSIKLIDDVACVLLNGHSVPIFFDRNNIYISVLQDNPDLLNVCLTVDNHNWLEAEFKPDDFRKYEVWKDI